METKELKIQAPEGYEIDKENSTLECIRFKPIKKDITYEDICDVILKTGYFINNRGEIREIYEYDKNIRIEVNNAPNRKQLERLLALNQLLNIAEYYNNLHAKLLNRFTIIYDIIKQTYTTNVVSTFYKFGTEAFFNKEEDVQSVIDNPNFREILDTIYKD